MLILTLLQLPLNSLFTFTAKPVESSFILEAESGLCTPTLN